MSWILDVLGIGSDSDTVVDWCDEHDSDAYICEPFHHDDDYDEDDDDFPYDEFD